MIGLAGLMSGLGYDMPLTMGSPSPLSQIGGVPSLQSESDSLPGMSSQSPFSGLGAALMGASGEGYDSSPLQHASIQAAQPSGFLQQLLGALSQRRY